MSRGLCVVVAKEPEYSETTYPSETHGIGKGSILGLSDTVYGSVLTGEDKHNTLFPRKCILVKTGYQF